MGRSRGFSRVDLAAVRSAPGAPVECVLHAEHDGVAGEPGTHASHR